MGEGKASLAVASSDVEGAKRPRTPCSVSLRTRGEMSESGPRPDGPTRPGVAVVVVSAAAGVRWVGGLSKGKEKAGTCCLVCASPEALPPSTGVPCLVVGWVVPRV